jgi:hypothetical protein
MAVMRYVVLFRQDRTEWPKTPCTCVAYEWPHRPSGGLRCWPDASSYRSTIRRGTHCADKDERAFLQHYARMLKQERASLAQQWAKHLRHGCPGDCHYCQYVRRELDLDATHLCDCAACVRLAKMRLRLFWAL